MEIALESPSTGSSSSASASTAPASARGRSARLDALLDEPVSVLERLDAEARTPSIASVHGDLRGRMLAWPLLDRRPRAASAVRAFASSSVFPWRGKSFAPGETPPGDRESRHGEGINRVLSDRFRLYRFETSIGPSRAGDFDALQLDYDLPENPWFIRRVKDEIRELEAGVWLGQAYVTGPRGATLVLYFALAAT